MKGYLHIILLLLCTWYSLQAQTKTQDSLLQHFNDTQLPDSVRYGSGLALAQLQIRTNMDSSRATGEQLLDFAKKVKNTTWQAQSYKWIGITYAQQGQFTEAQNHFRKNYTLVQELGDKKAIAIILGNIGTVFYEMGNYPQAQEYILQSLQDAEVLGDSATISRALNNLGNVNYDMGNGVNALDYYQRSLAIKEQMGLVNTLSYAHNNIGLVHSEMGDHKAAIASYSKSLKQSEALNDLKSVSRAYGNFGMEYSKMGNYNEALDYLNRGLQIMKDLNDDDGLANTLLYRGRNYLSMNRPRKALEDCRKVLDITLATGAINLQKETCDCLSRAYAALGDYKTSLNFQQRYTVLKDSLFNKERTREITRAEMNYAFEKKQLADSINFHKLQTAQQVAYERRLNQQNTRFYVLLIVSLMVIGFLTFLYYKYRQNLKLKKVENQLLNTEIEYKTKDLTTLAVNISNNQEWAESLAERLELLKAATGRKRQKELEQLEAEIKNKIWVNKDSDDFYQKVDELSSSFYTRLNEQFDGLTKTDVRLCSFIKLDLNTKQIATLQNINPASVKMSRNRLRKKLNLNPEEDLSAFLHTF
ncbi:MAG: tetratricopeptide repeat protein [Bacteroidota bacterium]